MFDTLLIANRGEIACRVIRTARAMGLRTVAVYSDADRDARHVHLADTALRIGTGPARDSYLDIAKVIDACKRSGEAKLRGARSARRRFLRERGTACLRKS